jgi:hypothetical protein
MTDNFNKKLCVIFELENTFAIIINVSLSWHTDPLECNTITLRAHDFDNQYCYTLFRDAVS